MTKGENAPKSGSSTLKMASARRREEYVTRNFEVSQQVFPALRLYVVSRKWNVHIQANFFISNGRSRARTRLENSKGQYATSAAYQFPTIPDGNCPWRGLIFHRPYFNIKRREKEGERKREKGNFNPSKYHRRTRNANSFFDESSVPKEDQRGERTDRNRFIEKYREFR